MVLRFEGSSPETHHGVADELVEGTLMPENNCLHFLEILVQKMHDLFRTHSFGETRKSADIGKQHSQIAFSSAQFQHARIVQYLLNNVLIEIRLEGLLRAFLFAVSAEVLV